MDVGGKCELCNWFSRRCVDMCIHQSHLLISFLSMFVFVHKSHV